MPQESEHQCGLLQVQIENSENSIVEQSAHVFRIMKFIAKMFKINQQEWNPFFMGCKNGEK